VQEKMVPKCVLLKSILLHVQWLNYGKFVYELENYVGQETLSSNLLLKLGPIKKIPPSSFPNRLLENIYIESSFPYAQWPPLEVTKQNTIGVIRGANSKLLHHKGHVLTYQVEDKMSFIHHVVKQYGCGCTIKDDESQDRRTQGHLLSKPKPRLM
jgi:hypothetical protein